MIPSKFDTRLVFEILRSELLPKLQRCVRRRIGKFDLTREVETEDGVIRSYANRGVPIVFEIVENASGKLALHRERPAFFWEPHWEEHFGDWVADENNALGSAEFQDGLMWLAVQPQDIVFNVVPITRKTRAGEIMTINHFATFRPESNRAWKGQLEMDVIIRSTPTFFFHGVATPRGPMFLGAAIDEYLNTHGTATGAGRTDQRNQHFAECGFIHDPSLTLDEVRYSDR